MNQNVTPQMITLNGEIQNRLNETEHMLNLLEEGIGMVSQKTEPVRYPVPVGSEASKDDQYSGSQIAERIASYNAYIKRMAIRLKIIADEIQL